MSQDSVRLFSSESQTFSTRIFQELLTVGQVVGLLWMFTSLIVAAGVIASMTAALTVAELTTHVRGPEGLAESRVGTVPTSTSEAYLRTHRLQYHAYATVL
jgi:hypothetical protein